MPWITPSEYYSGGYWISCACSQITQMSEFEDNALIYIPSEDAWYPTSLCLWTDAMAIGGQVGISALYVGLEELFVHKLNVTAPKIENYVE